ncbi:hypothetical protein Pcinc_016107 [Petrolisthes cinctipes]|uniref:Uncharacterized protein n=1 Tax=Petrolisthes cinctipes TaxID=88211 RepID=A0AAE1KQ18_PETCI|nr:hypothetical protein Pcinc_016107 [Petrolisthes cinctipes]
MTSTVQLDITHLAAINLTAEDVQAKFVTFKGSFQREVKKIHNTPSALASLIKYAPARRVFPSSTALPVLPFSPSPHNFSPNLARFQYPTNTYRPHFLPLHVLSTHSPHTTLSLSTLRGTLTYAHIPNYYLLHVPRHSTHSTTTYSTCNATLRSLTQQLPTPYATPLYAHAPNNYLLHVQRYPMLRATLLYAHVLNNYLLHMPRYPTLTHPTTTYSTCHTTLRSRIQQLPPTPHATPLYAHVPNNYPLHLQRYSTTSAGRRSSLATHQRPQCPSPSQILVDYNDLRAPRHTFGTHTFTHRQGDPNRHHTLHSQHVSPTRLYLSVTSHCPTCHNTRALRSPI